MENESLREEFESKIRRLESQLSSQRLDTEQLQKSHNTSTTGDDLGQREMENARLRSLTASLESEIERIKDSTHEQRIRALDLKHELREVSTNLLCVGFFGT